jgi:hypothetical protein
MILSVNILFTPRRNSPFKYLLRILKLMETLQYCIILLTALKKVIGNCVLGLLCQIIFEKCVRMIGFQASFESIDVFLVVLFTFFEIH